MFFIRNVYIRNEIIKSILAIILSVIISYIIHFIVHVPFTKAKLIISIVIPALVLPFFVIPNYLRRKAVFLAQKELRSSVIEKNILVQEIQHRVKNNLSIVLSLLHLQKQTPLTEENVKYFLLNYERRIHTISLAHENILNSPDYSTMDLSEFIQEQKDLVIELVDNPYKQIEFNIDPIEAKINLVNAVPIGLIISELIMNSYQHAFQNRYEGKIDIRITDSCSKTILIFKDDGIGIQDNLISGHKDTIGMTLISILADQLKGKFEFQNANGTQFTLILNN